MVLYAPLWQAGGVFPAGIVLSFCEIIMHLRRHLVGNFAPFALLACACLYGSQAAAQATLRLKTEAGEPQWIWSAGFAKDQVPAGVCLFRKAFNLDNPEAATIQISCDDHFELFVNGRRVGEGSDWKVLHTFDVKKHMQQGRNAVAVRAENRTPGSAGLVVRVTVKQHGNTDISYSTDATWRTNTKELAGWERTFFDDTRWPRAQVFGELGRTDPWRGQVAAADGAQGGRFTISAEFDVQRVIGPAEAGSLIAMTFNEFGEILASREGGPLLLIVDKDRDGIPDTVTTYCDKLKSCQGILALNGQVFAVGEGPEGTALYRLSDDNQDRQADTVKKLVAFKGEMGEHGPHAPRLGPDGLIYLVTGNHTSPTSAPDPNSPYGDSYEGDLVQPKYEDAGGHAVGIKAPGGTAIRTDIDGSFVQTFAGGFRNPYDIAFNRQGELFTFDSDMEWDEGLPWYRPTRVNHVTPGAEFGWRSGWSKWPAYYIDSLPATIDIGRGSPTGLTVYDHYMYPVRYHNALFACDWSQGRILAIHMKPAGASYEAKSEVFLEGRPLNVTDIEVGPDGWLYFTTGGRGTEGGVYRIVWTGRVPPQPKMDGVMQAVRQPQLYSAWGRQRIARIQEQMGDDWAKQLTAVADHAEGPPADRTRALDLMQLFGPQPTPALLVRLAHDGNSEVRAKAAYLMGLHSDATTDPALAELLLDVDATVRRVACESLGRGHQRGPTDALVTLLADPDRYVAWAARRALERTPRDQWQATVLAAKEPRAFLVGSVGLLIKDANRSLADAILARASEMMKGYLNDGDFVDLLRVVQLAMINGNISGKDVPQLARQLADEYPAAEPRMNRELVRLLVHLQQPQVIPRMLAVLASSAPFEEKLHVAFHARYLGAGWTTTQRLALLQFYEDARRQPGGHSYTLYLDNVTRDFVGGFNDPDRQRVLAQGTHWPTAALYALAALPEHPGTEMLSYLMTLDGELRTIDTPEARLLGTGIVAVLGRSRDERGMAYLRQRFDEEPARRQEFAMGLAQKPDGANWPILLRALPVCEGGAAQEVLVQLAAVDRRVEQPEPIRQVILCGLKLREKGGADAVKLLSKWTGEKVGPPEAPWDVALASWQQWFTNKYPDQPPATLPREAEGNRWGYQDLMTFLSSGEGAKGDPRRGAIVFEKAQCIKCHRFDKRGEGIGPDLTTVAQRFQKKEIIESVLFPSQVISDQYASRTVTTKDGQAFSGIVVVQAGALVVLQANGEKATIQKQDVDEVAPNSKSAMPEGLFNNLSLEEIADLFAYLYSGPGGR
jgi:putative heme-binding domain-containing protein